MTKDKLIKITINGNDFIEYNYFKNEQNVKFEKIKEVLSPSPYSKEQRNCILEKIEAILFDI